MKLVNLIKVGDDTRDGDIVIYISAGNGYFPRFGHHPVPINEVYKFADSEKLYVWDGTLLRPSEPEEGDIAYGSNGRYAGMYRNGWWMLSQPPLSLTEEGETDAEVYELRIGNVVLEVDPVKFVADNRELIDEIMDAYLRGKQEASPKDNTLVSIFAHEVTGTAPLKSDTFITIGNPNLLRGLGESGHIRI